MLSNHLSIVSSRANISKKISAAKASSSASKGGIKKHKKKYNKDEDDEEIISTSKPRSRLSEAREELNNHKSKLEDIVSVLSVDKNNKRRKSKKALRHHVKNMNKDQEEGKDEMGKILEMKGRRTRPEIFENKSNGDSNVILIEEDVVYPSDADSNSCYHLLKIHSSHSSS